MPGVTGTSRGARRLVTGKFRCSKPSRHVEMVWKNAVTSRRQARVCRSSGTSTTRHDTTNRLWHVADLSWAETLNSPTSPRLVTGKTRERYGQIAVMEFRFYHRCNKRFVRFYSGHVFTFFNVFFNFFLPRFLF